MLKIKPFKPLRHSSDFGGSTDSHKAIRARAFKDHRFFVQEFFGDHVWGEMSPLHREFCNLERNPDRRSANEVILAPRGNAKTTFSTLIKVVHSIVYDYHKLIVVVGWSADEAIEKVADIRSELLENDRLIEVYGRLLSGRSAKKSFVTRNRCMVVARSRGGQIRGLKYRNHRPSLVICDDIESLESVNTPEQRQKTKTWFFKDVMGAGGAGGQMDVRVVGTLLHPEALLGDLLKAPGWYRKKYKAILSWATHQELWDDWKSIYSDLENPNAVDDARAYFDRNQEAMLEGTKVLWPDGETYYDLMVFMVRYGKAALYSEKQNEPYDPDKQILDPDQCGRFEVIFPDDARWPDSRQGDQQLGFYIVSNERWIHSSTLKVIAFHDPALTETKTADYSAIVVAAQDANGYIYVLDCWMQRADYTRQIENAYGLFKRWEPQTLYVEFQGFQKLLKPLFQEAETRHGFRLPIQGVTQHSNKIHRISTLEPYFSNGWIKFNQRINPLLIDQLRLFPTTHDDGPDALQGCVERFKRPLGEIITEHEGVFIR